MNLTVHFTCCSFPEKLAMDMMYAKQILHEKLHADKHVQVKLYAGRGGLGKAHLDTCMYIYICIERERDR